MFQHFQRSLIKFLQSEEGPTAVEYAVMLALVIVACILSITAMGSNANRSFTRVSNVLSTAS